MRTPTNSAESSPYFETVASALRDPAQHCARLALPYPLRAMEPMERWQARAVLLALDGHTIDLPDS